jgi:hypothetical protein
LLGRRWVSQGLNPSYETLVIVMAGLVPAIHVYESRPSFKAWMPGTGPGMTKEIPRLQLAAARKHFWQILTTFSWTAFMP